MNAPPLPSPDAVESKPPSARNFCPSCGYSMGGMVGPDEGEAGVADDEFLLGESNLVTEGDNPGSQEDDNEPQRRFAAALRGKRY